MKVNIKKMIIPLAFTCMAIGLQTPVIAADAAQNYAIWGEGSASCHAYGKGRASNNDSGFKSYVRGYLTSYNTLSGDTYNITGAMKLPEIMQWLDKYCEEKEIDSFDRAIQMLINSVEDERFKTIPQKGVGQGWGQ